MRDKSFAVRLCGSAAAALVFVLVAVCLVQAGSDTTAHEIAERFANEAAKGDARTRAPRAEAVRRKVDAQIRKAGNGGQSAEEAEMLARARAEAELRRLEMLQAREQAERADGRDRPVAKEKLERAQAQARAAEAARQAEADRRTEEARQLVEARKAEEAARAAEAVRQAEELRKVEEERRLAEIRRVEQEALAAEEVRRHAEAQRAAEAELAELRRKEDEARSVEARRVAEAEQQRQRLEAEREAEAERLAERLRNARQEREARLGGDRVKPAWNAGHSGSEPAPPVGQATHRLTSDDTWADTDPSVQRERHVAVLLLMQPGDQGIRRNNRSADPVLCGFRDCYVSNGPDSGARLLPARKALGFFRTWGQRAGLCNNSLGCVFRGVDLAYLDGLLMPVDMRVVRHDRRQPQEIAAASECRLDRGRLVCRKGIYADDYIMWVVPESLAARAGAAALMEALEDGLPPSERTASAPASPGR